jgi:hypothetical protein
MKTITHQGHRIDLEWHDDDDARAPWKEADGHGPVSEWTTRDKLPGEWILNRDRTSHRFYDARQAQVIALKDNWGISPEETARLTESLGRKATRKEVAAAAVEFDFQYHYGWCHDEWRWMGYSITITTPDRHVTKDGSLWGISSDNTDCHEAEAIAAACRWIDREVAAAMDAACRDIPTFA